MKYKILTTTAFAILTISLLSVMTAPTFKTLFATSEEDDNNGVLQGVKPPTDDDVKKPKVCQVKVQVKVLGAVNGTTYIVQLDDLLPQSKQAVFNQTEVDNNDNNIAFMFQFKKGGDSCPEKDSTVLGNVNGFGYSAYINSLTKPNKVGVEIP